MFKLSFTSLFSSAAYQNIMQKASACIVVGRVTIFSFHEFMYIYIYVICVRVHIRCPLPSTYLLVFAPLSLGSNLHLICKTHRLLSLHKGLGLCSIKRKRKRKRKKKKKSEKHHKKLIILSFHGIKRTIIQNSCRYKNTSKN